MTFGTQHNQATARYEFTESPVSAMREGNHNRSVTAAKLQA